MKLLALIYIVIVSQGWAMRRSRTGSFNVNGLFYRLWPEFEHPNHVELDNKRIHFYMHNTKVPGKSNQHRRSPGLHEEEYSLMEAKNMFAIARDMNISLPTIVFVHGYKETEKPNVITDLISDLKETNRWNIILVDWHALAAGPWYPWAVVNVPSVGRLLAIFLDTMARMINEEHYYFSRGKGLTRPSDTFFKNLHLVGFSLGAHVAGIAGHLIRMGRIGRITGIEPALPMIDLLAPHTERLDPTDAEFVDVIHTCSGRYGTTGPVGHVDFYPNGGKAIQPGCTNVLAKCDRVSLFRRKGTLQFNCSERVNNLSAVDELDVHINVYQENGDGNIDVCSHWRAWAFFAESMLNEKSFEAVRCGSWKEFEAGLCTKKKSRKGWEEPVYMGLGTRRTARGNYYLRTHSTSPYSIPLRLSSKNRKTRNG